jgi:hypothetical protein
MKPEDNPTIRVITDPGDGSAIVPIDDGADGNMDDWLASLRHDGPPIDLGISAAELVAEARRGMGWDERYER